MKCHTFLAHYFWMVLLFSKGFAQFWFDTPFDGNVAEEGTSVTLICSPRHPNPTNVGIYQIAFVTDYVAAITKTYKFENTNGEFTTTIGPLTLDDPSEYMCEYDVYRCSNTQCYMLRVRIIRSLYVIPYMPSDDMRCSLIDKNNGIFFTGDQVILRCSGSIANGFQVSIRDEDTVVRSFGYDELTHHEDSVTGTTLIVTPGIEQVLNEATIYCRYGDAPDYLNDKNYCSDIRRLSVFAGVDVTVSPRQLKIPNRRNAILTCQSNLSSFASSLEWEIMDEGVVIGDTSMISNREGTILTLTDIDFTGSTSGMFTVSCNVTVGTRSRAETITVSEERISTSSLISATDPPTNAPSTTISSTNAASASIPTAGATPATDDMESAEVSMDGGSTAIVIAIPVAVGIILICTVTVIVIAWYCKTSTTSTRKTDTTPSIGQTESRVAQQRDATGFRGESHNNYSYEESVGDARMGYSSPDDMLSVDNVAYVSYDSEKP